MKNLFLLLVGFAFLITLIGCTVNNTPEVPILSNTPLPTPTATSTKSPIPTKTFVPTPEPIFDTLGPPFIGECGIPRIIVDNSFNGIKREYVAKAGHVDLWVVECNPHTIVGEVTAPISGYLLKRNVSFGIRLPDNHYFAGMEQALVFMGVATPDLKFVSEQYIDLGHIELIEGVNDGDWVDKGQVIANMIDRTDFTPSPILAYQIRFQYKNQDWMASPTILTNDDLYPVNFEYPDEPIYDLIFPESMGPFLCDFSMQKVYAEWHSWFCYPVPNEQR